MAPDRPWEKAFLEGLRRRGKRQLAADFAGVTLRTVRNHERQDPELKERTEAALQEWMEKEAKRRLERVKRLLPAPGS